MIRTSSHGACPSVTHHETHNGPTTFGSIFSHTVGSWCSGPALDMFCHEPNTRHQKIGSRFRAETGHRRSRFGVALADLGGVLVGDNTPGDFLAINQSRVPWVRGACSLALCDLRRAGVRCRSPTLRSLSYPGELWIFAERCDSSERSGPYLRLPTSKLLFFTWFSQYLRLPISKLPFFTWFSEYLRLPTSKLPNYPTITLLGTFTPRLATPRGLF